MKEQLVNLHAGLCTLWVDHALLEPEIPRDSLVLIANSSDFEGDGIYALSINGCPSLYMCSAGGEIAISHSFDGQKEVISSADFTQYAVGKVVGLFKMWL